MEGYEVVLRSQIDGDFEGFDDEVLFKLMDGSQPLQEKSRFQVSGLQLLPLEKLPLH